MKRSFLKVMATVLVTLLLLSMFAACSKQGEPGITGPQGASGADGKSAYELAVENGYSERSPSGWLHL